VSGAEVAECFGKCMNGGICSNGGCICSDDYEGSNCQYIKSDADVGSGFFSNLMILLVYGTLALIIIGLFVLAGYFLREAKKKAASNQYKEKPD
jgi:hypothetical protein